MLGMVIVVVIAWFAIGFVWVSDERNKQNIRNAEFFDELTGED